MSKMDGISWLMRIAISPKLTISISFFLALAIAISRIDTPHALGASQKIDYYNQESPQGNDYWTWRGPQYNTNQSEAPLVYDVLFDPTNPSIVYAASNQGVYRSTNTGDSWSPRNTGLGGYGDLVVMSIIKDPNNASTLFIGTWGYGVFRSTDNGNKWTHLADPLGQILSDSSQDSGVGEFPPLMLVGGASPDQRYPTQPVEAGRTFLKPFPDYLASDVPASNYIPQGMPLRLAWTPVNQVAIHPGNSNELYACISFVDGVKEGLYRSANGGTTWMKLTISDPIAGSTNSGSSFTYTFAPSNSQVRFASFTNSLYKTTNGGSSWTDVGKGKINYPVAALAVHPVNPNIVLAGTRGGGLYRTIDGGSSWNKVVGSATGEDVDFHSVAFSPNNPTIVYAGGHTWIYRSTNTGQTWNNADNTLVYPWGFAVAIHPSQPETILAGSGANFPNGGVYKRTNPANSFQFKPFGMEDTFVLDIEQDPVNSAILYAATWGGGIFRSDDSGLSWNPKYGYPYVISLEAVPQGANTILYAGTFFSDTGILKSLNRGDSWTQTSLGYKSDISYDLEAIGTNPNQLVAATYLGMQYTSDGGSTWQDGRGLNDGIVLSVCEFGSSKNFLAGTYGGGAFWSPNGIDWFESNLGMGSNYIYDIACASPYPSLAFAGTLGVYRTRDAGQHWEPFMLGLPNDWVRALDYLSPDGDVFAGMHQSGVFVLPRGIGPWTDINASLIELRIRSLRIVRVQPTPRLFAGTSGIGSWEYTMVNRPPYWGYVLPLANNGLVTFSSSSDTYEPNNYRSTAYSFPSPGTYFSYIYTSSDVDWYRINVTSLGTVTAILSNIPINQDYDLELYSNNGILLARSIWGSNHEEKIFHMPSQTGYHYLKVFPYQNSANQSQPYRLEISFNSSAPGGNGIYGLVTEAGSPASNIPILMRYNNGYFIQNYSTLTDGIGYYHFRGLPALPVGHTYQLVYPNYEGDPSRVSSLVCTEFLNYPLAAADLAACSIEIAKNSATSPGSPVDIKQIPPFP